MTFQQQLDLNRSARDRVRVDSWPRLLILAPFAPDRSAPHGGARVMGQFIARMAKSHLVALCYLRGPGEASIEPALRLLCDRVEEVNLPVNGSTRMPALLSTLNVWKQVLSGIPLWAGGRACAAFNERVSDLLRSWSPDIIQLEYHIMGQFLPALQQSPAPRVLVQHEPGQAAARERWRSRSAPGRLMPLLDLLAWKRFEPSVVRQVQTVVVFTERDRQVVAEIKNHPPILRIPFGTEIPDRPLSPLGGSPPSILFIGSFQHAPNVDAARRLVRQIFPAVQARFPEARLVILGSDPPLDIQQAAGENILVPGYVPDVRPYLDQAALVAAPLRQGGGMRVKVVEALAAGKAVVASPLACEGLALSGGQEISLAESDEEFSQSILLLLEDAEGRAGMARRARAWACQNLSWEASLNAYEQLYQSLRER